MSALPPDPIDASLVLGQALGEAETVYALGGAAAFLAWGVRDTGAGASVQVFAAPEELPPVRNILDSFGISLDGPAVQEAPATDSTRVEVRLALTGSPAADDAMVREAWRTRSRRTLRWQDIWVLSAEVLAVTELLGTREGRLDDVRCLVEARGFAFDEAAARHLLAGRIADAEQARLADEVLRVRPPAVS